MADLGVSKRATRAISSPSGPGRLVAIDLVRGLAICGMVAFHLKWDLADWHWQDTGPTDSAGWMLFGHAVAGTFLFVAGFCLVLARRHGIGAALRRIAVLAGTALMLTAVTHGLFPEAYIFFGILHCITLASLIGLVFIRAPALLTLAAGLVAAALPSLVSPPWFESTGWSWLGLTSNIPPTLDYRPILPWLSALLFGIVAARLAPAVPDIHPRHAPMRGLAWAGRHSLAIYLVHQPILFGFFSAVAAIHPATLSDQQAAFGRQCRIQCVAAGAGQAGCDAACACVLQQMRPRLDERASTTVPTHEDIETASRICMGADPKP